MPPDQRNDPQVWERFVQRLIQKTDSGDLTWSDLSGGKNRESLTGSLFFTPVSARQGIVAYRYDSPHWVDEDTFIPASDVAIEITDLDGKHLWTIPKTAAHGDLLDLLQFQQAEAATLFSELVDSA